MKNMTDRSCNLNGRLVNWFLTVPLHKDIIL